MKTKRQTFGTIALALMIVGSTGCSTLANRKESKSSEQSFMDRMPWSKKDSDPPEPYPNPVKVAATWTPDTLVQTGRTPTRGFGGRVFFYDEKSRAVPVDGTLIVHGFDDAAETQESRVKRFEFTPEQFTRHFSQSDLGASYSVWIPWDAIGGQERRISLVTSFRTSGGKTVQGVPTTVQLPGTTVQLTDEAVLAKLSPQYQRYLEATRSASAPTTGLTTTTIVRRTPKRSPSISTPPSEVPTRQARQTDAIAKRGGTPSVDVDMIRTPAEPTILPASAQVPVQ